MIERVKELREEYESALDAAETKREGYHAAIRSLYMSGMPLRLIAEALNISHQRVHKIVGVEPETRKRARQRKGPIVAALVLVAIGIFAAYSTPALARLALASRSVWVSAWLTPEITEREFRGSVGQSLSGLTRGEIRFVASLKGELEIRPSPQAGGAISLSVPPFATLEVSNLPDAVKVSELLRTTPGVRRVTLVEFGPRHNWFRLASAGLLAFGFVCGLITRSLKGEFKKLGIASQPPPSAR